MQEIFDRLSGPIVLICGQNKVETNSKEKEKFVRPIPLLLKRVISHCTTIFSTYDFDFLSQTMILPNFGRIAKLVRLPNFLNFA